MKDAFLRELDSQHPLQVWQSCFGLKIENNTIAVPIGTTTVPVRVEARQVKAHTSDLVLRAPGYQSLAFPVVTLLPALSSGEHITVCYGWRQLETTLGEQAFDVNVAENGGEVYFDGGRLLLPGGTRVASTDHLSISCPVSPGGIAFRLEM